VIKKNIAKKMHESAGRYVVSLVMLSVCPGRAPSDSAHLIPNSENISIFFI